MQPFQAGILYYTADDETGIFTSVTLAVTGALKVFDLPWVMVPNGAPQGLTHFLGTYMYQQTFGLNNYDYGSTLAVLIVVLGIVVSKAVGFSYGGCGR